MSVPRFESLQDVQDYLDRLAPRSVERVDITGFQNSWVNYGGSWDVAHYIIEDGGYVKLGGLVKLGIAGVMFQLPPAVAPRVACLFPVLTDAGIGRVDVDPAGNVVINGGAGNAYLSLASISFYRV